MNPRHFFSEDPQPFNTNTYLFEVQLDWTSRSVTHGQNCHGKQQRFNFHLNQPEMHLHTLYAALFIKWNSPASCQYQWESDTHPILSVRNLGQIYKKVCKCPFAFCICHLNVFLKRYESTRWANVQLATLKGSIKLFVHFDSFSGRSVSMHREERA